MFCSQRRPVSADSVVNFRPSVARFVGPTAGRLLLVYLARSVSSLSPVAPLAVNAPVQPHWNLGNGLSTLVAGETPNMSLFPPLRQC